MDGIFVAYHNTAEIFGFQYIPRELMDIYLYGSTTSGDAAFSLILQIYTEILELATGHFPNDEVIKLTFVLGKEISNRITVFIANQQETSIVSYLVTGTLMNKGFRQEYLEVSEPNSLSDVKMNLILIPNLKPNEAEYNAARAKVMEVRGTGFDDKMPEINDRVMRIISEKNKQKNIYF
jgi:hypothetical protein